MIDYPGDNPESPARNEMQATGGANSRYFGQFLAKKNTLSSVEKKAAVKRPHQLICYACLLALTTSGFAADQAVAQTYPARPVTLISPIVPGGAVDSATRAWAACASDARNAGQPVVLVTRPGANGLIAVNTVRHGSGDGYTLLMAGTSQMTVVPYIYKKQPFDPLQDFQPAALFATTPFLLVASTASGIKNIKDLQAYAKARPKGIDLGITAISSPPHLLSEALSAKLGIESIVVPLGGEAQGITALLGGQIPAMIFVAGSAIEQIRAGKLVPLMVFSDTRIQELPDVPTVVEELRDPSLVRAGWMGIWVKAGTPENVIKAVETWTKACVNDAKFKSTLVASLIQPRYMARAEFTDRTRQDIDFWRPWITRLNISND